MNTIEPSFPIFNTGKIAKPNPTKLSYVLNFLST